MLNSRHQVYILTTAILPLLAIIVIINGVSVYESRGVCQATTKVCHGIPVGNQCKGIESFETKIEPKEECGQIQDINSKCNKAGKEICNVSEKNIDRNWSSTVEVYGQSCETWNNKYSLNLTSC